MSAEPLTDASAVLKTTFTGDTKPLEQASARSEQIVRRTADNLNQILSKPAGFSNLATASQQSAVTVGQNLDTMSRNVGSFSQSAQVAMQQAAQGINTSFSTVGTGVQSSMTTAQNATQQAAAAMQTNLSRVANAAATVPPALTSISATAQTAGQNIGAGMGAALPPIAAIGTTATQAGAQASAGLNSITAAAQSPKEALRQLDSAFQSNQSAIVNLSGQIAGNRTQMAQLASQMTQLTTSGQKYVEVTNEQGKTSRVLSDAFTGLRNQYMQLGAETRVLTAQQGTYRAANQAVAQSITQTAEQTGFLTKLFGVKTNMVSTAGTAFMGYDRVLQTFLGSMGGVTLATSLGITALGFLIPKLINLASETERTEKVTRALVESDVMLANIFARLASQSNDTSGAIGRQSDAFQKLIDIDARALLVQYTDEFKKLKESVLAAEQAEKTHQESTRRSAALQSDFIVRSGEVIEIYRQLESQAEGATTRVIEEGAAREKLHAALDKTVKAYAALYDAGAKTVPQLLEMARAAHGSGDDFEYLSGRILIATRQMIDFERAARDSHAALTELKAPQFTALGTEQGIQNALSTFVAAMNAAGASLTDFNQMVAHAEAPLRNLREALRRYAEFQGKDAKDALRVYREEFGKLDPEIQKAIRLLDLAGKNTEAFSDRVKKAKLAIQENSPLLTERAIAGSPEAIKTVVDRFVDSIVNSLNSNKERVGEVGSTVAAMFIQRFEASLGKDKKSPFFDAIIDDLRKSVPELDAQMARVVESLKASVGRLNIELGGLGLNSEQTMRSIIDSLRKQVGITDDMWKRMSASQKQTLDADFREAASVYISQLRILELKAETAATNLKVAAEREAAASQQIFDAWVRGTISTADAVARLGGIVEKTAVQAQNGFLEVEMSVASLADQIDLQLKKIKDSFDNNYILQTDRFESETRQSIESVISFYERYGEQIGLTGEALDRFVNQKVRQVMSEMKDINKETIDEVIKQHERLKVRLPGIWDEVFKDASASTRRSVDDMLTILNELPGGVGDIGRKIESEVNRWWTIFDRVIRLIERALGEKETEGLGGVLKDVVGIFKKSTSEIKSDVESTTGVFEDLANTCGTSMGSVSSSIETAASATEAGSRRMVNALTAIGAAAGMVGQMIGGRAGGVISGAGSGLALGAQIGAMFGPGGILPGAIIGAIGGGIASLFGGGGPSEEEKRRAEEQRKLEIERIRQDLAKGYQELQQAVIETATRAHALLEAIIGRARVPKAEIQGFVKDMTRLLRMLVKELATIPKEVTEEIKVISENLLPSAELMAAMPQVFDGINRHMPMAESQARLYVNDWGLLTNLIGELAEETPNKLEKQMRKFANRMMPVAELTITVSEGMNAVFNTRPVSATHFRTWASNIDIILVEVSALEEKFDRYEVRKAAVFSENVTKTFGFLKEGSEGIRAVVGIPTVTVSDLQPFAGGVYATITVVSELSRAVNSEMVVEAQRFEQGAGSSVTFMLNTARGFKELDGMKDVMPNTIISVGQGVKLSITILAQVAREVDQEMRDDAELLSSSVGSVFTLITSAAQSFTEASQTRTLYPATMRAIGDGVQLAIVELARVSRAVGTEMATEANAFATSIGSVFTVISAAGGATRDLKPEDLNVNGLIMLIGNIEEATVRVIDLAKRTDKGDVDLAVEWAESTRKIFDSTAAGISIQKEMAGLEPISISQWDNYILNTSQMLEAITKSTELVRTAFQLSEEGRHILDDIAHGILDQRTVDAIIAGIQFATRRISEAASSTDQAQVAKAVEYSRKLIEIFNAVRSGIAVQNAMATSQMATPAQWDAFAFGVSLMSTALLRSVEASNQAVLLSNQFKSNTDTIRANVELAINNLLSMAATAASYLARFSSSGSTNALSLSVSQSVYSPGPSSSAPATSGSAPPFVPQSGGGGGNTYVTQHIYGSVLYERELDERIEQARERARDRGNQD